MDNEEEHHQHRDAAVGGGGMYNENSMVAPPNLAAMRTCACFGQNPSDPNYWQYSVSACC